MIRLCLAVWLALALPGFAAPVQVTSGEHDGFTRLVLTYDAPVNWQLGRSVDGYELRLDGPVPSYDLRQAFDLIGKSRLAAIWLDPATNALHLGLACACHAIPFEFRPGIVVIDLKDGPPPKGSAFEEMVGGQMAAPLAPTPPVRPRRRPADGPPPRYDWLAMAKEPQDTRQLPKAGPVVLPPDPALQPLRDTLLRQMAQGAAAGVVAMERPTADQPLPDSAFPMAQVRIGDAPEHVLSPATSVDPNLTAKGASCIAPERLALADWGDTTRPLIDQLAENRHGLTGEFDRPDDEAIARHVRFLLFLGFGAEARQSLAALAPKAKEAALWAALAHLLDDEPDPSHSFAGMAACEGPAALWALLEQPLAPGEAVAAGAIRLAFSDLPLHLRELLGPRLAERFLALGDEDSARALQDAIRRAPEGGNEAAALMEARLDLHQGHPAAAEEKLADLLADPGPDTAEALIALTEARAHQNLPVEKEVAVALHALLAEHAGDGLAQRLRAAWVLAEAASGQFATAFGALDGSPEVSDEVWSLTATLAPDGDFLAAAVLPADQPLPTLNPELRAAIARRLLGLGLARSAAKWMQGETPDDPVFLAQIALGQRDGRAALVALAGMDDPEATRLKLLALELTGQDKPLAGLLTKVEKPQEAALALARAGEWQDLSATGVDGWSEVAARLETTAPPPSDGTVSRPLAEGANLLAAGEETRALVVSLLASLPAPTRQAATLSESQ